MWPNSTHEAESESDLEQELESQLETVELLAEERRVLYWRTKELREEGELTARVLRGLKSQAVARTLEMWGDMLSDPRGVKSNSLESASTLGPDIVG
ncbi:hypothetical protein EAI_04192 [Harpegnathos saltator]|uniref:Uncharacterized protein n=1 Tax=Harpegnathos saltator TaxID=610380 RepID=E2BSU1_HARSA|nr:hypothetical protein EAI_04192 [Harpegnathos saltator]